MLKQFHKQVKNDQLLQQVQHLFEYREQTNKEQVVFNQPVHFIRSQVWIHPLKWRDIFPMIHHRMYLNQSKRNSSH